MLCLLINGDGVLTKLDHICTLNALVLLEVSSESSERECHVNEVHWNGLNILEKLQCAHLNEKNKTKQYTLYLKPLKSRKKIMSLVFRNRNMTALQLRISPRSKVLISGASRLALSIKRTNRLLAAAKIPSLEET